MRHWELALQQSPVWCHLKALRLFARSLPAHCLCVCVMECAERIWNSARQLLCIPHTKRMQRSMFDTEMELFEKGPTVADESKTMTLLQRYIILFPWISPFTLLAVCLQLFPIRLFFSSLARERALINKLPSINQECFGAFANIDLKIVDEIGAWWLEQCPDETSFRPNCFLLAVFILRCVAIVITKLGTGNWSYLAAVYFT